MYIIGDFGDINGAFILVPIKAVIHMILGNICYLRH